MSGGFIFRGENLSELISYRTVAVDNCRACGSSEFSDFGSPKSFPSVKCNDCGLIWMRPSFTKEGLDEYYSNYIGKRRINNDKKMEQRSEQYKIDVEFLERYKTQGRLLDIGCSGGFFLNEFSSGFEKFGIEIDPSAVAYANEEFSSLSGRVQCSTLENFETNELFDLITMRGVIEHVTDPERDIAKVSSMLKEGGIFGVAATPNSEAVCVDIYQENWTLFHPVQHLWHFSKETLSKICSRHGLHLVGYDFPYLGTPYENVLEDIKEVAERIKNKERNIPDDSVSGPFFGNMMSLAFKKSGCSS